MGWLLLAFKIISELFGYPNHAAKGLCLWRYDRIGCSVRTGKGGGSTRRSKAGQVSNAALGVGGKVSV